jgi:hypothetical protein
VCGDASNSISVLTGIGNCGLMGPGHASGRGGALRVAIGDINGDGDAPICVSANFASSTVTILRGLVTDVPQCPPFENSVIGKILLSMRAGCAVDDLVGRGAGYRVFAAGILFVSPGADVSDIGTVFGYSIPFLPREPDRRRRDAERRSAAKGEGHPWRPIRR